MTVSTKHFEIGRVSPPVSQPSRPRPNPIFGANLGLWVNVVKFKNSNVGNAARTAFAAQSANDFRSFRPICLLLSSRIRLCLAGFRAVTAFRGFSAAQAFAAVRPSFGGVATMRAIARPIPSSPTLLNIEGAVANFALPRFASRLPVWRETGQPLIPRRWAHFSRALLGAKLATGTAGEEFSAFGAVMVNWLHGAILAQSQWCRKYFNIACRRVEEAYRQPDLFVPPPTPPSQEAMDL